jgi:hypothetical protein
VNGRTVKTQELNFRAMPCDKKLKKLQFQRAEK